VIETRCGILFIHGSDEWYGSDVVLYDTIRALAGTEFHPHVVLPDDINSELPSEARLSSRLRAIGVSVTVLPLAVMRRRYMTPTGVLGVLRRSHTSVEAVLKAIDTRQIGIVHSHTATVLTGARVAARLHVPHVWHVSEIVQRPRIVRYLLSRFISRHATRVVAVSEAVRDHLSATVPAIRPKCDVIFNALDTAPFGAIDSRAAREHLGLPDGSVVGMIGRVGTMKGQEILLAAAPAILKHHPNTTFMLVGGVLNNRFHDIDKLKDLAEMLGVASHVRLFGFDENVARVIAAMDIVVQPSTRPESFGMTVLEAMASRKPVVAAAHGGVLETVRDGVTGVLFPPSDSEALATAINALLSDGELRARMGEAGRALVDEKFSLEPFREGYLRVYRGMVEARSPA
jgi:glycosyltransferase involved in cell wall biosynthesis